MTSELCPWSWNYWNSGKAKYDLNAFPLSWQCIAHQLPGGYWPYVSIAQGTSEDLAFLPDVPFMHHQMPSVTLPLSHLSTLHSNGTTEDACWVPLWMPDEKTGPHGEVPRERRPVSLFPVPSRSWHICSLITWAPSQGLWGLPLPHLESRAQVEHSSPISKPSKLLPLCCAPLLLLDTMFWGSGALGAGFAPQGRWRWCRRAASSSVLCEL